MRAYYYLLASLPYLHLHAQPPLSHPDLLALCIPWLSSNDLVQLQLARIDIENVQTDRVTHPKLIRWLVFEHSLRNELVRFRAQNLGIPADLHLRKHIDEQPVTVPRFQEVLGDPSPYKTEMTLLEIRWQFLTDQEVGHYFDLTTLMMYSIKLQLLERKAKFQVERGRQIFRSVSGVSLDVD